MARRRRHKLTDGQFGWIEEALPEVDGRGRPYEDPRKVTGGIFRADGSGALWRDLPERYGSWRAAHDRFRRWLEDGTLQWVFMSIQNDNLRQSLKSFAL